MQLPESFFRISQSVYQDDPDWLGENPLTVEQAFSASSDYRKKGGRVWADVVEVVADAATGSAQGVRLAGFFDPDMRIDDVPVAYFGYWETIDNLAINQQIFQRFEDWARQQGAAMVYGPINFNTYGMNRVRVSAEGDAREAAAFIGEPYNPDYYAPLLEQLGYRTRYRYFTRINNQPQALAAQVAPLLEQGKQALAGQFHFQPLTADIWRQRLAEIYPITDRMFRNNFAYSAITEAQFFASCGEPFAKKLCPHSSVLVTDANDAIAGYFLSFPDYSPLIRDHIATQETVNFAEHFDLLPEPRMALAKTGAVHPDYRKAGLFTLMSMQLTVWGAPFYQRFAASLVREDNPSLKYASNGEQQREYGLYMKVLAE